MSGDKKPEPIRWVTCQVRLSRKDGITTDELHYEDRDLEERDYEVTAIIYDVSKAEEGETIEQTLLLDEFHGDIAIKVLDDWDIELIEDSIHKV